MITNIASSIVWFASAIVLLNALAYLVSLEPSSSSLWGIPVGVISDTIPVYYAIPLIVLALELNALAAKWSK